MEHEKTSDQPGMRPPQDEQTDDKHEEAHVGVLAQRGYRQVSLPIPLIERIGKYIDNHKDEGFTSIPEFIRVALREKLDYAED